MTAFPPAFAALLTHPAPGLLFEANARAGLPERAYDAPLRLGAAPSSGQWEHLLRITDGGRGPLAGVVEFYRQHDGADLFIRPDVLNGGETAALSLLPIELWDEATAPFLEGGDNAWQLEDFDLYSAGRWKVIAASPSEDTCLTLFFDGEHEGSSLAGRVHYLSLDPVHSMDTPVAPTFTELLERIGRDPAKFLNDIGWGGVAEVNGQYWGDPCSRYLEDVRAHPSSVPGK